MLQIAWEKTAAKEVMAAAPAEDRAYLLQIHPLEVCSQLVELGELSDGPLVIGRDPESGLRIDDISVSRHHAEIRQIDGQYEVRDLGSTNGTCINERPLARSLLAAGDRLQFGGYIYKFLSSNHIELQYHEAVYSMMTRDGLTGVLNKRSLQDQLQRDFSRATRRRSPLSLILLDVDHFKRVNDTHGHLAGDEVLKAIGQRISGVVAEHDIVARFGGEEFAVLLSDVDAAAATDIAERCRQAVAQQPFVTSVCQLPITISLGVADVASLASSDHHDRLVEAADAKLYEAKRSGRDRVCS